MRFKKYTHIDMQPAPIPRPKVLRNTRESEREEQTQVRMSIAGDRLVEEQVERPPVATQSVESIDEHKLSKLIDDDFPFDESQLAAIEGVVNSPKGHACLTGAAGTGKTTCTKAVVERIKNNGILKSVNMAEYFKTYESTEEADDYEAPEQFVPSVVLCGFTGRSTQMIKKNFPRDWHGNIMTIHRMLRFMPEWYEDIDESSGDFVSKMRFVPTYTADNRLPWDVIIIDEAGMVSVDLWEMVREACKPGCRVIMIGDINQLPPVHGRSVFGFAMSEWPSFELTHIHRQQGVNNSIVDNAWRILKGQMPVSDDPKSPDWKFIMTKMDGMAGRANQQIRGLLPQLIKRDIYDPLRDTIITPINGDKDGAKGFQLGQIPLNADLALMFNSRNDNPRYVIDAGRERRRFAVGDKVMATKNDHNVGITNGMTGVITSISANGAYAGDHRRFGPIDEVNAYIAAAGLDDEEDEDVSLEDLMESHKAVEQGKKDAKEARDRGPASHIVTVHFGSEDHGFEIPFATLAEVASLMMAYVVTCHKMQGGESPTVIIICHGSHKSMLNREWLYTAVTRASNRCIVLFNDLAIKASLSKQRIVGRTLQDKIKVFQELSKEGLLGPAVKVNLEVPR